MHRRLTRAKSGGQRQAGSALSATNYIPFALTAWAVRLLTQLPYRDRRIGDQRARSPSSVAHDGPDVLRLLPIPPIALHLRTGIAMLSYGDDLVFGITADYDAVPDVDELASGIEAAVARLVAMSEGSG